MGNGQAGWVGVVGESDVRRFRSVSIVAERERRRVDFFFCCCCCCVGKVGAEEVRDVGEVEMGPSNHARSEYARSSCCRVLGEMAVELVVGELTGETTTFAETKGAKLWSCRWLSPAAVVLMCARVMPTTRRRSWAAWV